MLNNMLLDDEVEKAENKLAWARKFRQQHKVKGQNQFYQHRKEQSLRCSKKLKDLKVRREKRRGYYLSDD